MLVYVDETICIQFVLSVIVFACDSRITLQGWSAVGPVFFIFIPLLALLQTHTHGINPRKWEWAEACESFRGAFSILICVIFFRSD